MKSQADDSEQKCKFPFKYQERVFYGCTRFDDPMDKLWCSIETDNTTHQHQKGKFGFCEELSVCDRDEDFYRDNSNAFFIETKKLPEFIKTETTTCPCKPISECNWVQKLNNLIKHFNPLSKKTHPSHFFSGGPKYKSYSLV